MAKLTIKQLVDELAALRAHCARREAEWDEAQTELKALRIKLGDAAQAVVAAQCDHGEALREIARLQALVPAVKPAKPAYQPPPPSAEWLMRRAALDAAREAAMVGGRVVKAEL